MSELHLLDILAARRGCFISDLNLSPILRRAALLDLCRMEENKFPLSQWQDSVRYLTGIEKDFTSEKQIRDFILKRDEQNGRKEQPANKANGNRKGLGRLKGTKTIAR